MPKRANDFDVLVLGDHPSAYACAAALRFKGAVRVMHATVPGQSLLDQITLLNPAAFALAKEFEPLERKIEATSIYGMEFVADDGKTRSDYKTRSAITLLTRLSTTRDAFRKLAESQEVVLEEPTQLNIVSADEKGVVAQVDGKMVRASMLIVAVDLPHADRKVLGIPEAWEQESLSRYTFVRMKNDKYVAPGNRPLITMSLDMGGTYAWAWLLCHGDELQLTVQQSPESTRTVGGLSALETWLDVLKRHQVLTPLKIDESAVNTQNLPLGGALALEGVTNRTLLIGPAGGFYAMTGEELYPSLWSAVEAADVARKALKEPHLQDALQPFRHKWRTTLGDYLRGPQQNLRFLLPLVYRNPVMTSRLVESILLGKSVVR